MSLVLPKSVDDMKDIIDIEGIVVSSTPDVLRGVIYALAAVAIFTVLIWLIRKIIKKIQGDKKLSPHEKAWAALRQLKKRNFIEQGESHQFYFALDEILRRYIYERFGLDVLEKTYEQIKARLKNFDAIFSLEEKKLFTLFLDRSQLVKFAKMPVEKNLATGDLSFVESFVNRTKTVESEKK